MASRNTATKKGVRALPVRSEQHTQAYLVTRETLRRIGRSAALAYLTSNAVTMHWSGLGSSVSSKTDGARA